MLRSFPLVAGLVWWGGVATIAAVGHLPKGAALPLHAKGKGKDVLACSFKHTCVHSWIHGLASLGKLMTPTQGRQHLSPACS